MPRRLALTALCLVAFTAHGLADPPEDTALPLDPGTWRLQTTATGSGDVPPEILRLPPAQRAAAERRWREQMNTPQRFETTQCVTPDDLRLGRVFEPDDGCTQTVERTAAREWTVHEQCTTPDGSRVADYRLTLLSRTSLQATATIEERDGQRSMSGRLTISGTRVAATCAPERRPRP